MKRVLKSRELVRILESHGWQGTQRQTSHIVYRHPNASFNISFPYRAGKEEIRHGLLRKLERLSGLSFRK